jgi:hypothetical protein
MSSSFEYCGAQVAEKIWLKLRRYIPKNKKREIAEWIYELFCEYDTEYWDKTDEQYKLLKAIGKQCKICGHHGRNHVCEYEEDGVDFGSGGYTCTSYEFEDKIKKLVYRLNQKSKGVLDE